MSSSWPFARSTHAAACLADSLTGGSEAHRNADLSPRTANLVADAYTVRSA